MGDPGRPRSARHGTPLAAVAGAVLLANLAAVLHLVSVDPRVLFGGVSQPSGALLPGNPFIDPNAGFLNEALGHLAAVTWLHGHVPWWNPFEGIGTPLVAEGQNGALFPLVLLLAWGPGFLVEHLVLEVAAGWATYFLVRRLGVGRATAGAAGVAFGLCGTFAWFAGNPGPALPFLPLALLGVERATEAARTGMPKGWRLLAVSVGGSILAGFPETAFIDGMLVALWLVARLVPLERRARPALVGKGLAGLGVGVALAAPLEVAFAGYLPHAVVGGHSGGFSTVSLPTVGLAQLLLPYGFGPIFAFHSAHGPDVITSQWDNVGGYVGVVLVFSALVGAAGARRSPLRAVLVAWTALCVARTYGFAPVVRAMAPIPGLHQIAFYRYANASWTLALVVLGALGVDDVVHGRAGRLRVSGALALAAGLTGWATLTAWRVMDGAVGAADPHRYVAASAAGAGALLLVSGTAAVLGAAPGGRGRRPAHRRAPSGIGVVVACTMGVEAVVLLGVTQLSAPTTSSPTTGATTWLAAHLGTDRFATLGPIQPNYGSSYGIGEVDTNDLPFPKPWARYVAASLDPNAPPIAFTGGARLDSAGPTPAQELVAHLAGYEAVGVRYVIEPSSGTDVQGVAFPPPGSPAWPSGPRRVYADQLTEIWELPSPTPLFTADAVGRRPAGSGRCGVRVLGLDSAVVRCGAPSVLVRRQLALPGWSATVAGRQVPVVGTGPDGLFQAVRVPAGTSEVTFDYLPPGEKVAEPLAVAGLVLLLASVVPTRRRRSRRAQAPARR